MSVQRNKSTESSRITVSDHAVLRYRQRGDAAEPFPREKIRERLETADRGGVKTVSGIGWVSGDLVIVTDSAEQVVRTVLRRQEKGGRA